MTHSIEQLKKHVDAARSRKLAAEQALAEAVAALHAAQCEAFGIAVGDIVQYTGRRFVKKPYRVASIGNFWENGDGSLARPYVLANPQRADKKFGTGVHNIFSDWEKLPADQPESAP